MSRLARICSLYLITSALWSTAAAADVIQSATAITENLAIHVNTENSDLGNRQVNAFYPHSSSSSKMRPVVVDVNNYQLSLDAVAPKSLGRIVSTIYGAENQHVVVNNISNIKPIQISAVNGATQGVNGIFLKGNSHLTINGPIEINKVNTNGDSAAGIAIQDKGSEVIVNGDVTVQDVQGIRERGAGINAAGIRITGDGSAVKINGLVDFHDIHGSGIYSVGANTYAEIKGGTITAVQDPNLNKKYYAIRVEKGVVNVNMDNINDKYVTTTPGSNKVNIVGDIIVNKEKGKAVVEYSGGQFRNIDNKGVLNLGLTTKDSSLDGLMGYSNKLSDYGSGGYTQSEIGTSSLYLQNGAQWVNRQHTSLGENFAGSQVINLIGSSAGNETGVIYQRDSRPITIGNVSGESIVMYEHTGNGTQSSDYAGGDIVVKHANQGAMMSVGTDSSNINMNDTTAVSDVLGALANKLTYVGITEGENNLQSKVQIAEGLTSPSVTRFVKPITFDSHTGKGIYNKDFHPIVINPEPVVPSQSESVQPENPSTPVVNPTTPENPIVTPGTPGNATVTPGAPENPIVTPGASENPIVTPGAPENPIVTPGTPGNATVTPEAPENPIVTPGAPENPIVTPGTTGNATVTSGTTENPIVTPLITPEDSVVIPEGAIINPGTTYGSRETQIMRGVKEATLGSVMLWRADSNDLSRRMGEIRLGKSNHGTWGRYLGGRVVTDIDNTSVHMNYSIGQIGYDYRFDNGWIVGGAFNYGQGRGNLSVGYSDNKLSSISLYSSKQFSDGRFVDMIGKYSRVNTDYTVMNNQHNTVSGSYITNGMSFNLEYGKRFLKDNGTYWEPSLELTIGRLSGKNYNAMTNVVSSPLLTIQQDSINSAVGRAGLGVGKQAGKYNVFGKIALAHEFAGSVNTRYIAANQPTTETNISLRDTWIDAELGGTYSLKPNTYVYGTVTTNLGAKLDTKWRIDAGVRLTF